MRLKTYCLNCKERFALNTDSPAFVDFPVAIVCPHCGSGNTMSARKDYPKVAPDDTTILDGLLSIEQVAGEDVSTGNKPADVVDTEAEQDEQLPFYALANKLGEFNRASIRLSQRLKREIDNFTIYVTKFFDSQWQYATQFARCWRPGYMQEFLSFPFLSLQVDCEDELARLYSRWIVSPLFFESFFGYKMHPSGGFRLELVNQYSRLQFKFDPAIMVKLGVPEDLKLEVRGTKIIGPSLRHCWRDIPGVAQDADHCDTQPSIYIKNHLQAKTWLARHAVTPQEQSPVKPEELFLIAGSNETFIDMNHKRHIEECWHTFLARGRVAVYWYHAMEARRFAYLVANYIKGIVAVFTPDRESLGAWKTCYTIPMNSQVTRTANKLVYFMNGEIPNWKTLPQCKLIIIDHYKDIDGDIIDRLFDYSGRMILLADNPLFDFQTTNVQAARLHALVPWQVQEFMPQEQWPMQKIRGLPDIQASLLKLTNSRMKVGERII